MSLHYALYTNILHCEGIAACKTALETRPTQQPSTEDICTLIEIILTKNNFTFNKEYYLQLHGTAVGTRMAPSYAMDKFEQQFLTTQALQPLFWWRYVDDIFLIWPHGESKLHSFYTSLNEFHHAIKFTIKYSSTEVVFLDTTALAHTAMGLNPAARSSATVRASASMSKQNCPSLGSRRVEYI